LEQKKNKTAYYIWHKTDIQYYCSGAEVRQNV